MLCFYWFLLIAPARINHRTFWFNLCCLSVSFILRYLDLQLKNDSASQLACGRYVSICLVSLAWLVVAIYLVYLVRLACGCCLPHLPCPSGLWSLFASFASFLRGLYISAGLWSLCACLLCLFRLACSRCGCYLPRLPHPSGLWSLFALSASFSVCLCVSAGLWLLCACVLYLPCLACGRYCLP